MSTINIVESFKIDFISLHNVVIMLKIYMNELDQINDFGGNMISKIFDLNIDKILDDWETYHAVREIIANALDEQLITNTQEIEIYKDENQRWHIRDYGRGIKYCHLTQNENNEKISNPNLIGKFGIGLKDALATFERKNINVLIQTRYGDITIHRHSKHNFDDIITLHAEIKEPKHPDMIGTDFIIEGVSIAEINRAKELFLQFTTDKIVEDTRYGQILMSSNPSSSIYLNGMKVADEDDFLFSYNITSLDKKIKSALNRERTNVGRSAYSDRVKLILKSSISENVAQLICEDLEALSKGFGHDEISWIDVQEHAVKLLNSSSKVVFVSSDEIIKHSDIIDNATNDGMRIVAIPDSLVNKVRGQADNSGKPILELTNYIKTYNESFQFKFVDCSSLNTIEKSIFDLRFQITNLVGGLPDCVNEICISETMREDINQNATVGCWDAVSRKIIIKRSQLASVTRFSGILLHEVAHAKSNYGDVSRMFEEELTSFIGILASKCIEDGQACYPTKP